MNSILGTSAGNYPITVAAVITTTGNNNGGTTSFTVAGTVDFNVVITNPCTQAAGVQIDAI